MLALVGPKQEALLRAANQKSAEDMARQVRAILPRGDAERGHLVDSVRVEQVSAVGFSTSIGDEAHPYPAKLEWGHKARDGSHVPAVPAWFPARRVTKKRARGRITRAERAAIKTIATPGGAANE